MWDSIRSLAVGAAIGWVLVSGVASADEEKLPGYEVLDETAQIDPQWVVRSQQRIQRWLKDMPIQPQTRSNSREYKSEDQDGDQGGVPKEPSSDDSEVIISLLNRVIQFARSFEGPTQSWADLDFRGELISAMSHKYPGFAWVIVMSRSGYKQEHLVVDQTGGAFGIQIPLMGTSGANTIRLPDGEARVSLRFLPIGGILERREYWKNPYDISKQREEMEFVFRPGVELDARAAIKIWGNSTLWGARIWVQPRFQDPADVRVLSEIYATLRFKFSDTSAITEFGLTPHCEWDWSGLSAQFVACRVNLEFALGI